MKDSEELTKNFIEDAKQYLENELKTAKLINLTQIKLGLAEHLSKIVYSKTDRKPIIIPIFMPIEI
jgi:mRNA degradation ribonuclease J1/J2